MEDGPLNILQYLIYIKRPILTIFQRSCDDLIKNCIE